MPDRLQGPDWHRLAHTRPGLRFTDALWREPEQDWSPQSLNHCDFFLAGLHPCSDVAQTIFVQAPFFLLCMGYGQRAKWQLVSIHSFMNLTNIHGARSVVQALCQRPGTQWEKDTAQFHTLLYRLPTHLINIWGLPGFRRHCRFFLISGVVPGGEAGLLFHARG